VLGVWSAVRRGRGLDLAVSGVSLVLNGGEIVESGPVDEVLDNPTHPYTRGLLDNTPQM
jgi:ABC-type dipeptide/oligopeptide/nickel transport system ATPase component